MIHNFFCLGLFASWEFLRSQQGRGGGGTTLRGQFFLRKKGHFLKYLFVYCKVLGARAPSAPGSYVYGFQRSEKSVSCEQVPYKDT